MVKELKDKLKSYLVKLFSFMFIFLIALSLFSIDNYAQNRQNCTDNSTALLFKYLVPVQNVTTTGDYIDIDYLSCNVTFFKKELDVDNILNSSLMVNEGEGDYTCWISFDYPVGKYNTFYECYSESNLIAQDFGRFEIVTNLVPLAISLGLAVIAALFIFISFRSQDKVMNPLFFFLGLLLIIVNIYIAGILSITSQIENLMFRIYSVFIIVYSGGFILFVFLGWFYPFIVKAFNNKKTDEEVEEEVQ